MKKDKKEDDRVNSLDSTAPGSFSKTEKTRRGETLPRSPRLFRPVMTSLRLVKERQGIGFPQLEMIHHICKKRCSIQNFLILCLIALQFARGSALRI